MSTNTTSLESAYQYCQELAQSHYENFPVASKLLPKRLRRPISVIYAFARNADDFADEGDLGKQERYALLANYHQELDKISDQQSSSDPVFIALADVIQNHDLPINLLHDLLDAFEQDITTLEYEDYRELLNYCHRSANPVGRLMLHLYDKGNKDNCLHSDNICSALQLINFLQDIRQDWLENGRCYIPQKQFEKYGVSREHFQQVIEQDLPIEGALKELYLAQVEYAEKMLRSGKPLLPNLSGRFALEIRLIYHGGYHIIKKLKKVSRFSERPRLTMKNKLFIAFLGMLGL